MPPAEQASTGSAGAARKPGKVYTFYSYKGGVGRSMALANVAALLAKWGRKVLIVDWDLEAPGLERYFIGTTDLPATARADKPGLVDLIKARAEGRTSNWRECVWSVRFPGWTEPVRLITAGRSGTEYVRDVQMLNWSNLFAEHGLGNYLEELRNEWAQEFDLVLIDSRTGVGDIGGICTILLPDALVLFFTSNRQSIEGVAQVMRQAREAQSQLPIDRSRLIGVPVPSRDERHSRETEKANEWVRIYAQQFHEFYRDWLPQSVAPSDALQKIYIPYFAVWSFGERLPVVEAEQQVNDPASIVAAYARLATLLNYELDWKRLLTGAEAHEYEEALTRASISERELELVRTEAAAKQQVVEQLQKQVVRVEGERSTAQKSLKRRQWIGIAVLVVAVVIGAYAGFALIKSDEKEATRRLAAATSVNDPLLARLLLRELEGLSEPKGALESARQLASDPAPVAVLEAVRGKALRARFDRDGSKVVALCDDQTVRVWPADGRGDPTPVQLDEQLIDVAFGATDDRILVVTRASEKNVSARVGRISLTDEKERVFSDLEDLAQGEWFFSPSGDYLGFQDSVGLFVYDRIGAKRIGQEPGVRDRNIAFAPLASKAYATWSLGANSGRSLRLTTLDGPRADRVLETEKPVALATWNGRIESIVTYETDHVLRRYDVESGKRTDAINLRGHSIVQLLSSPTHLVIIENTEMELEAGDENALMSNDRRVAGWFWPLDAWPSANSQMRPLIQPLPIVHAEVCATKPLLALTSKDGRVRIWNLEEHKDVSEKDWKTLLDYADQSTSATLSPSERSQYLGEAPDVALENYEKAERAMGRTPRPPRRPDAMQQSTPPADDGDKK